MSADFLTSLFTLSFGFGVTATVLSFVFGLGQHGPFHLPHVGHAPHHLGSHAGAAGVSPFNFTSIFAFLIVFGAVGLAAQAGVGALLALLLASAAGLFAGWLAFIFLARFLVRGQTILIDEPIGGTVGRTSVAIGPGRIGEVIYTRNGVRRSDGARSVDGKPIAAGEDVVIVGYANGMATVQRWSEFMGESSSASHPTVPINEKRNVQTTEPK